LNACLSQNNNRTSVNIEVVSKQIILSPHFDDAVFSCWHLINHAGSEVITVFAGIPPDKTSTLWDKLCGQSDSVQMMQDRTEENRLALTATATTHRNLGYLDHQYTSTKKNDVQEITNNILSLVSPESHFFVPLAGGKLWNHSDHIIVREVGKLLLSQGKKVSFYADVPYMWIPSRLTNMYKKRLIKKLQSLFSCDFSVQVYELNKDEQNNKLVAMKKYQSQYKLISLVSLGTLKRKANLEREVYFSPLTKI
jgi:LmbE family N-acetylglucosaminyl deacetylase